MPPRGRADGVHPGYFARGTAPIDVCLLHRFGGLRALFFGPPASEVTIPPPAVARAVVEPHAPQPASQATAAAPTTEAPEEKKKKRGFWGRLFGKGDGARPDKSKKDR